MSTSFSVVELDAVADVDTAVSPYFAEDASMSWPAAERTRSTLGGHWPFRQLLDDHGVPKEYATYHAGTHAACTTPPEGFICVYADAFHAGMRVPLHDFHAALLRHYGLAPAQLAPNAWRYVAAFVLLCRDAGVDPMLSLFQHFFSVCTHKGDAAGWHHFKPSQSHHGGSCRRRLFSVKTSTTRYPGWKSRFFFLQAPPDVPWPCPVKWGKPTRVAVSKQPLNAATLSAIEKLLDRVGDSGIDVVQLFSRRSPPIGRTPEIVAVKKEPETSKRKSTEPTVTAPGGAGTFTPTGSARRARPAGSFSGGERSATATFSRLAQMVEAELDEKEQELQERNGEVAGLKKEMRAARDAHAAEVARLGDGLQAARDAHEADVAQLGDDLDVINHKHAAEVDKLREEASRLKEELRKARSEEQAVKTQHKRELVESRRLMRGMYRQLNDLAAAMNEMLPDDDKDDGGGDVGGTSSSSSVRQ